MDQQLKINILTDVIGSDKVEQLNKSFSGLNSTLINYSSGIFLIQKATEAARAGLEQFTKIIDFGDNLKALSEKTGIAADQLTQFQGAAKSSNLSFEALEKSLKKFTSQLGDVGNEKFISGLKSLGINAKDSNGQLQNASQVLLQLSDKFSKMQDGPTKAAIAVQLFGKAGADMIPLLNLGSKEIEKFAIKMGSDFPDNADRFNDALDTTKRRLTEQSTAVVNQFLPALSQITEAWNDVLSNQETSNFGSGLTEQLKIIAGTLYGMVKELASYFDEIFTHLYAEFVYLKTLILEVVNTGKSIATLNFSNIGNEWKKGDDQLNQITQDLKKRKAERLKDVDIFQNSLISNVDKKEETKKTEIPKAFDSDKESKYKKEIEAIEKFKISQKEQIELQKYQIENYSLSTDELNKNILAMQLKAQADKESVGWSKEAKKQMAEATDEIIRQKQEIIDLQSKQKQSFEVGAKTAFKNYIENLRDVSKQTEQMFTRAFGNMEDAIVSFAKTGKLSFKNFADAVVEDLIRISVRQATVGFISSIATSFASTSTAAPAGSNVHNNYATNNSFATGGVMTGRGSMPLRNYAGGGIATMPQVAVFGEGSMPEAYVPLPNGKQIPVDLKNAGGGGNVVVNVSVNANGDSSVNGDGKGQSLGNAIANAVKTQLLIEKRPGGLLYA